MNREGLELRAKNCCPAELWYDLMNTLEETTDSELYKLISDYEKPNQGLFLDHEHDFLEDKSSSNWLKSQIKESKKRDVVDMINDTETLLSLLNQRLKSLQKPESC